MQVHQFFLHNSIRNFNYLIETDSFLFCIDPFDTDLLIKKINEIGKPLKAIINTHEHWDHVGGNKKIKEVFQAPLWAHHNAKGKIENVDRWLNDDEEFRENNHKIIFKATPGHTLSHMCLFVYLDNILDGVVVGDTVFVAGVGNCHNGGDPATLYETINRDFKNLDKSVKIYPSHDYAQNNLNFTLNYDPENEDAKQMLAKIESGSIDTTNLVTTIETECKVNCFFRYDNSRLRNNLNMDKSTDKEVFIKLRELRNQW